MKTREEIDREWVNQSNAALRQYYDQVDTLKATREAALAELAELDDPMLRLLKEAKRALNCPFLYPAIQGDLRDAIDYAEQRRAQL
jgi:hypothetical protein